MSSNNLLNTGARAAKRPDMASYLQGISDRRMTESINKNNKTIHMPNQKNMSVPNHIFSWEYNMNELEFE
jgi:hypothetical protein